MKFRKSILALSIGLCSTSLMAGSIKVSKDINVTGDFAAGTFYMVNDGGAGNEAIEVNDFGLAVDTGDTKTGEIGFIGVLGSRTGHVVSDATPAASVGLGGESFALDFGYITYKPTDMITLDAGVLLTTIGAEGSASVFQANITRGMMWNSEPAAYAGVRASFDVGGTTVSAEVNRDPSQGGGKTNWQVNAGGSAGPVDYGVTYYDGKDSRNIIDALLSAKVAKMDLTAYMDYYMIDDAAAGQDDSAMGFGLLVSPNLGKFDVPVRIEYVKDGTAGVYTNNDGAGPGGSSTSVDSATSITLTPTYHVSDNSFVRAEVSYVMADKKVFTDTDGKATDSQIIGAFQIGYTF